MRLNEIVFLVYVPSEELDKFNWNGASVRIFSTKNTNTNVSGIFKIICILWRIAFEKPLKRID